MSLPKDPPEEEGPKPARAPKHGAKKTLAEESAATEAAEAEDLAGRPDTPVPPLDELRAALAWAFAGEEIQDAILDLYARHAQLLLEHNRHVNLTAVVDPKEVAAKHYLDSWRLTRLLPLYGKRVLDLGSGAGFPGLPVAIAEKDAKVTLLDSTQKRVTFMQSSIDTLAVKNASAVWARAEEHLARNNYDVVLVRAVSSVRENVRLLRKVRHSHKDLVMLKGPSWSREVRAGEREAERLGFKLDTVMEHELPGEMGKRAVLVYRAPGGHGS
ncbi:MAG: 16S rRNA (guanine(527)-N(7))-methyltransferase RsmG [Planctomycetota bacterium]|nr:16S rRNA (guanine(527)-N(7))-methyltransferase RsmG [Planctomycetota bacterium]